MEYLLLLFFALAVSGDGFIVGLAYGVRGIRIPLLSLVIISLASALAVSISMFSGKAMAMLFSPNFAIILGSILLILMGIYFFLQAIRDKINNLENGIDEPILVINIKTLGIIIKILKKPQVADFDASGEISSKEAFFLGLALALDALGAGIGVAMTGFNIFFTALAVGVLKFVLVNSGIILGKILEDEKIKGILVFVPGILLFIIGIYNIL